MQTIWKKMDVDRLTCDLSREIYKEASRQSELLAELSGQERHETWVAKLIAYQIGWGRLLLSWYHAGIEGKVIDMPGDGFTKWDYKAIKEHFHHAYLYDKGPQQEKLFQEIITAVLAMVEKESQNGNLDRIDVWPWCTLPSGKKWPLSKWVRVNTIAPWRATSSLLKKYLKTQTKEEK